MIGWDGLLKYFEGARVLFLKCKCPSLQLFEKDSLYFERVEYGINEATLKRIQKA